MWLQEKSWKEVAEYLERDRRLLVPVGSTEQHGAFAPLGTDTYVASALAAAASERTGVLVAPPLWYGWSPHHLVHPGTVSVRAEVLNELLTDVFRSLAEHGFRRFVVVNGHRLVNIPWLQLAAERAQRELSVTVRLFDPAYMSKEIRAELGFGPAGHAEEMETSHLMHLRPDLVRLELARDNPAAPPPLYDLDPAGTGDTLCYVPPTRADLEAVAAATGDAVVGRPTASTAEKGERYHAHLVRRLVAVLESLAD